MPEGTQRRCSVWQGTVTLVGGRGGLGVVVRREEGVVVKREGDGAGGVVMTFVMTVVVVF